MSRSPTISLVSSCTTASAEGAGYFVGYENTTQPSGRIHRTVSAFALRSVSPGRVDSRAQRADGE